MRQIDIGASYRAFHPPCGYKKTLEKPEEMYIGWQNAIGTQFALASAISLPVSLEPLEAVWFFPAKSWKEANHAWSIRNGWRKAG
jgi:hypothetical protein